MASQPLVSVVTPVYNGEKHLEECIESVLAQSYQNLEYIIVNNCSTDASLEIAERYEQNDARIQIYNNTEVLPILKNFNFSMRKISTQSKYCKVVHADDLLFTQCIELMVAVAEANPSIGIVSSYGIKGERIVGAGLPYPSEFLPGREIGRLTLMGKVYPFSRPSSLLIRSDLIRNRKSFYDESYLHSDVGVCYELLEDHDFGFVHQVLTFIRTHDESLTSIVSEPLNRYIYTNFDLLIKYGPAYLNKEDYEKISKQKLKKYYRFLSHSLFQMKGKEFWKYHISRIRRIGYRFSILKLACTTLLEIIGNSKTIVKIFFTTIAKNPKR